MASYDLPQVEGLSPEQAAQELNKIDAAWVSDDEHPYVSSHHPQHQDFVDAVTKLHEIKATNADPLTPLERGMQNALDYRDEVQHERAEEARELMNELVEQHGFDRLDIPDDVESWQLNILQMEKLQAEGDNEELTHMMRKELASLKTPIEIEQAFHQFTTLPDLDENLRHNILRDVLAFIRDAHEREVKA